MNARSARLLVAGLLVGASSAGAVLLLDASAAGAATASGCAARATSYDASGHRIEALTVPGARSTPEEPFRVDPSGSLRWRTKPVAPEGGTWAVTTPGLVDLGFGGDAAAAATDDGSEALTPHLTRTVPGPGRIRFASGVTQVVVVVRSADPDGKSG